MGFGAWDLFNLVDMKGDLGALIVGALLAAHPSAAEMSKKLMGFKDLLLVGFFSASVCQETTRYRHYSSHWHWR